VLYLLHKSSLFDVAALFAKAAQEFGFLTPEELEARSPAAKDMTMRQLLESIHLDYGFYLNRHVTATFFCPTHRLTFRTTLELVTNEQRDTFGNTTAEKLVIRC